MPKAIFKTEKIIGDQKKPLRINGCIFMSTFSNKDEAERCARFHGGFIEPYGVIIERFDPKSGEVTEWKKVAGFSVWRPTP